DSLAIAGPSNTTTDQQALLAFKSQITNDPHNFLTTNWSTTSPVCDWIGVSCDGANQRATALNLSSMGLEGTISPEIGNLSFLVELSLTNNSFQGQLPTELVYFRRLEYINLGFNNLQGEIPSWFGYFPKLEHLYSHQNLFSGNIPASLCNVSTLKTMELWNNNLQGNIPVEIGSFPSLEVLNLYGNWEISGSIPRGIFNISSLKFIDFGFNKLSGSLPGDMCQYLPNFQQLIIHHNLISGTIPSSLSKCRQLLRFGDFRNLSLLSLGDNSTIPSNIFNITTLQMLGLYSNWFSGNLPQSVGLGLPNLEDLYLWENDINGPLPKLSSNAFSGSIPNSFGSLRNLQRLNLAHNEMTDESSELSFLSTLANCKQLRRLVLEGNPLNAILPISIGNLSTALQYLSVESCQLKGNIPTELGNLSNLTTLLLDNNELDGSIPDTVARLRELQIFRLQNNQLEGFLPNGTCSLRKLGELALSQNNLIGSIPQCLGDEYPHLVERDRSLGSELVILFSYRSSSFRYWEAEGNLISMDALDLSSNKLSGPIPKSLEKLQYLKDLNLSSNRFRGEIPSGGNFAKFTALSFVGNDGLCSASLLQFPKCKTSTHGTSHKLRYIILAIILTVLAVSLVILLLRCQKGTRKLQNLMDAVETWRRFSYKELEQATVGFCGSNLFGTGGFGSVYKGVISDVTTAAIKIFNMQLEGAFKSFNAECEEYIPNGNLHKWLYAHNNFLDILQRLDIMIDVGTALEYLHHGFDQPIVHCDLKPSNVLLDSNMVAHVGDFGIARLIGDMDSVVHTMTLATVGYMAPEYGTNGIVSLKSDVYSFGILMKESCSRACWYLNVVFIFFPVLLRPVSLSYSSLAPTDEFFVGEMSLKQYVSEALPDRVAEIADSNLLLQEENLTAKVLVKPHFRHQKENQGKFPERKL
ncbi:hypothetical protein Tsubulata_018772, partial [Turnera subulata]